MVIYYSPKNCITIRQLLFKVTLAVYPRLVNLAKVPSIARGISKLSKFVPLARDTHWIPGTLGWGEIIILIKIKFWNPNLQTNKSGFFPYDKN